MGDHRASPTSINQRPLGGPVADGVATIHQPDKVVNIEQSTQIAIINWTELKDSQDAQGNFNQPNSTAASTEVGFRFKFKSDLRLDRGPRAGDSDQSQRGLPSSPFLAIRNSLRLRPLA